MPRIKDAAYLLQLEKDFIRTQFEIECELIQKGYLNSDGTPRTRSNPQSDFAKNDIVLH